jgi:predicted acyl esterase
MSRALIATLAASALTAAPAHAGFTDQCETKAKVKVCSGMVSSFDGTQLDTSLTTPSKVKRGKRLPLIVFLHGFLSNKGEYMSETKKDSDDYKTVEHNNIWFASRGYAVLNYDARGHGGSGGAVGLASKRLEIRDTQHLTGLLVDQGLANRKRVAAVGGSYGGGQTWLLMTTRGKGAKQFGSWLSPKRKLVQLAAVVPQFTWTDLLQSLVPNGRAVSTEQFGVPKQTLLNGFVATGGTKFTQEMLTWITRMNQGEPYDGDAVVEEAKVALTRDRSAIWQDGFFKRLARGKKKQRSIPVLAAQGWTDPIFASSEAVNMYKRLRKARRNYPIQMYFGDFEHLTSQIKIPDMRYYHRLATTLLDRYMKGAKRKPVFDVRSAPTQCDPKAFGPVVRAKDWGKLQPDRLRFEQEGTRLTGSPTTDPRGAELDHVVVGLQKRGCITTTTPVAPNVASWNFDVKDDFTLVGSPVVTLDYTSLGTDVQLNSRLWDVAPDGTHTLITRGVYRVGMPANGKQTVSYELFGNHWQLEKGHQLQLEVTGDDSTFFRRDNFPSTTSIDRVTLTLPGE